MEMMPSPIIDDCPGNPVVGAWQDNIQGSSHLELFTHRDIVWVNVGQSIVFAKLLFWLYG